MATGRASLQGQPPETAPDQGLPEVLAVIARAAGRDAALSMAKHFGGHRVYVPLPDNMTQAHEWAQVLGLATARAVARALEYYQTVVIPHGPYNQGAQREAEVRYMLGREASIRTVAHVLRLDRRTVQRIKARQPRTSDQLDLFD